MSPVRRATRAANPEYSHRLQSLRGNWCGQCLADWASITHGWTVRKKSFSL